MDGVVREPSALATTVGSPPSRTLTQELVVPRSMPTARAMFASPLLTEPAHSVGPLGAARGRAGQVEWTGLNDATGPPTVKSKLSEGDASCPWAAAQGTCPIT